MNDTQKMFEIAEQARRDLALPLDSEGARFLKESAALTALDILREKHPGVADRELIRLAILEICAVRAR